MISIEEIKEKQEELNKMIEEYEKKKDLMSTWKKDWKPKMNETYYYIGDSGNVTSDFWTDYEADNYRRNHLRIFQTKDLAEKWLEIDTYLREKSFEPDWNDERQEKYLLEYEYDYNRFVSMKTYTITSFEPFYFKGAKIIDEILENYTTEKLEFYFNIGE